MLLNQPGSGNPAHIRVIALTLFLMGVAIGSSCAFIPGRSNLNLNRWSNRVEWVEIPSGSFMMGSVSGDDDERPIHRVELESFWVSRFEVTNGQYQRCVKAGECTARDDAETMDEWKPVVNVDWYQARDYCRWLDGRLPTEAEWEKAARGDLPGARYPWGDAVATCEEGAENGAQFGYCEGGLKPVGMFSPNAYGLYDMAGNAWEWVADWYDKTYYTSSPLSDPSGPADGKYKLIRGGGWNYSVYGLRTAYRSVSFPRSAANFIGFRCARSTAP